MTPRISRLSLCLAIAAACCGLATTAGAKSEEWKNAKGETFRATPSEVLGPWALFDDGTLVPLSLMSDEDTVRFYQVIKDLPSRSADWKTATSPVSAELYGRLLHYSGIELAADNESGRPEPEFYVMFFTTGDKNMSWNMLQRSTPALYASLMKSYPDMAQGVVFGVGDTAQDQFDISVNTKGDWMFTVFDTEVQMRTLTHLIPTNLYGIVVMTRNGVPLFGPDAATDDQVKDTFQKFTGLLDHMKATDMKVWIARAHYFRIVQPVAFGNGHSDPMLMGNPLVEATLRKMKIFKLDATFHVAADGKITSVSVTPYDMTPGTVKMFTDGFQRGCLFVPAVDHGKFVDGTYTYHMEIAP
jgi:hypothetical protein